MHTSSMLFGLQNPFYTFGHFIKLVVGIIAKDDDCFVPIDVSDDDGFVAGVIPL